MSTLGNATGRTTQDKLPNMNGGYLLANDATWPEARKHTWPTNFMSFPGGVESFVSRTIIAGNLGCILPRVPAILVRTGRLPRPDHLHIQPGLVDRGHERYPAGDCGALRRQVLRRVSVELSVCSFFILYQSCRNSPCDLIRLFHHFVPRSRHASEIIFLMPLLRFSA